jgi:hypothetical protein
MEFEKISKIIKEKISKNEFGELKDILTNEVVVTKDSIIKDRDNLKNDYYNISRNGDILVGFYLEPNYNKKELTMTFGGRSMNNLILYPGQCTYFLNNKYMFPIISFSYSEIHVNETFNDFSGISCMFALLQTEPRRALANSTVLFKGTNGIIRGSCFTNLENKEDIKKYIDDDNVLIIEFPDMSIL